MSKDYKLFIRNFAIGLGIIVLANAIELFSFEEYGAVFRVLANITVLVIAITGFIVMLTSIKYYIREDLRKNFGLDDLQSFKRTIEYFTRDSVTGDKIRIPVRLSEQLSKPGLMDVSGDTPNVFSEGIMLESLGRARNKNIIYQSGIEGDSVGPLINDFWVTFVVLSGKIEQYANGDSFVLTEGETLKIQPSVERKTIFLDDSELIIVYEEPEKASA